MKPENVTWVRERFGEICDLQSAQALLQWDQEVYMPPKGAAARAQQLATLAAHIHKLLTDNKLGETLRRLQDERDTLSEADAALVAVGLYDHERATRLPETFVTKLAIAQSQAYEAWVEARGQSDFAAFQPHLERIATLLREKADLYGYEGSPYNALLEEYERGITVEQLKPLFSELREKQSALVRRIQDAPAQPDHAWIRHHPWPEQTQLDFAKQLLTDIGYDFEAGRLDRSVHPFTIQFALHDVRITTRLRTDEPFSGLMGCIHEAGHGLYSQGHDPEDERTPLRDGASLGMHESQSLFWENVVGGSPAFWRRYVPIMAKSFPKNMTAATPDMIYRAVNHVEPSLIRVEADECTYNLHIALRFELELGVIEGDLAASDIPEAWNAKMAEYLGVKVPDDAHGCLQDIHWSHGAMGYFPTYTLGHLYAAQLVAQMEQALPLWEHVESGDFRPVLGWLREKIHRHGRRKLPGELIQEICETALEARPYLDYLEKKYTKLYGL